MSETLDFSLVKSVEAIKLGITSELQKISVEIDEIRTVVWELWKEFSQSITKFTDIWDSGMVTSQYVEFVNEDTYKITKVECKAYVWNHLSANEVEQATLRPTIEVSNDASSWTVVADKNQIGVSGGQTGQRICEYEWPDGCTYKYIRCYSRGNSFKRNVTGVFSGYQKGV